MLLGEQQRRRAIEAGKNDENPPPPLAPPRTSRGRRTQTQKPKTPLKNLRRSRGRGRPPSSRGGGGGGSSRPPRRSASAVPRPRPGPRVVDRVARSAGFSAKGGIAGARIAGAFEGVQSARGVGRVAGKPRDFSSEEGEGGETSNNGRRKEKASSVNETRRRRPKTKRRRRRRPGRRIRPEKPRRPGYLTVGAGPSRPATVPRSRRFPGRRRDRGIVIAAGAPRVGVGARLRRLLAVPPGPQRRRRPPLRNVRSFPSPRGSTTPWTLPAAVESRAAIRARPRVENALKRREGQARPGKARREPREGGRDARYAELVERNVDAVTSRSTGERRWRGAELGRPRTDHRGGGARGEPGGEEHPRDAPGGESRVGRAAARG